jgi:hypothetical protein
MIERGHHRMSSNTITPAPVLHRNSSDDEILGLVTHLPQLARRTRRREVNGDGREAGPQVSELRMNEQLEMDFDPERAPKGTRQGSATDANTPDADASAALEPEHLRETLDANPELRDAWREAGAYRETFGTPEAARAARALLGYLNRIDALFYSRRPEDHAELAREVAKLDPEAFASLARAMNALANDGARRTGEAARAAGVRQGSGENAKQVQRPAQEQTQNQAQTQDRQRDAAAGVINQPGSGVYLQNASSSARPAVDAFTQGSYNLRVGDGTTAGLGINSGCIQVDATKE